MHRMLLTAATVTTLLLPAIAQGQTSAHAADPADVASPEAIVAAAYEAIGRRPGQHIDWTRFRTLFLPEARLIPNLEQTGGQFRVLSPEGFTEWVDGFNRQIVGTPNDRGFYEEGVLNIVERYGDIAHVMSTYVKHYHGDDQVLGRGINSFQLVQRDGRWWIVGIVWDEENGAGPIPAPYLP